VRAARGFLKPCFAVAGIAAVIALAGALVALFLLPARGAVSAPVPQPA